MSERHIQFLAFMITMVIATVSTAQRNVDYIVSNPDLPAALPGCVDMPDMYRENCNVRQLRAWVREHMTYPPEALEKGLEGRVEVAVTIDTSGLMQMMRVSKKVHPLLNQEALRLVQSLKDTEVRWLPAMNRGKKVISEYRIPVTFQVIRPDLQRAPTDQDRG
ncbi:MAG: energy transducer TonB [Saprospiraceae bacterium]|nr:energy transducer TonB [Saprospiraceae bacterium]